MRLKQGPDLFSLAETFEDCWEMFLQHISLWELEDVEFLKGRLIYLKEVYQDEEIAVKPEVCLDWHVL